MRRNLTTILQKAWQDFISRSSLGFQLRAIGTAIYGGYIGMTIKTSYIYP